MLFLNYETNKDKPGIGQEYPGYLHCHTCLAPLITCTAQEYIGKKYPARVSYLCGAVIRPNMDSKPFKPNERYSYERPCKNNKLWSDQDLENYNKVVSCLSMRLDFLELNFSKEQLESYIKIKKLLIMHDRFYGWSRELDLPLWEKVKEKITKKYIGPRGGLSSTKANKAYDEAYAEWKRFVWAHKNFRADLVDEFLFEYS